MNFRYHGERRSLRQRSASPATRQSVEFWEQEVRRGRSQEREAPRMPEKMPEKMAGGGIMERLASLQKHGEEEWRRRMKRFQRRSKKYCPEK